TLEMYGAKSGAASFANNCVLARRLVERGVRFVQLYHTNWDSHGGPGENLQGDFEKLCRETDQACAALVKDLKQRGLLEDTLVIWGGEFGRTPMGEIRDTTGRNHHIDAFTMWLAGGGVTGGGGARPPRPDVPRGTAFHAAAPPGICNVPRGTLQLGAAGSHFVTPFTKRHAARQPVTTRYTAIHRGTPRVATAIRVER